VITAPTVIERPLERRDCRLRQRCRASGQVDRLAASLAPRRAFDGDEARAETVDAGEILVAGRLVDLPLAAERGFLRLDAEAVGFDRAVAAAFANEIVDKGEFRRVGHLPALAAAALFGGAGLFIDQDRHARNVAQFALHRIEIGARMERHLIWEIGGVEFIGIVGDHGNPHNTVGADLVGDALHADRAVDRLAAGHRNGVVEQDLVSDVGFRSGGLADRHRAGVVISALAEILEHMRSAGEQRGRHPVDAFAAHLDQRRGLAVHPACHEVTADAG
jgi:hypothetical protein